MHGDESAVSRPVDEIIFVTLVRCESEERHEKAKQIAKWLEYRNDHSYGGMRTDHILDIYRSLRDDTSFSRRIMRKYDRCREDDAGVKVVKCMLAMWKK